MYSRAIALVENLACPGVRCLVHENMSLLGNRVRKEIGAVLQLRNKNR